MNMESENAPSGAQQQPGKVQAIAIMTLIGGIIAIIASLSWGLSGIFAGLATFGIGCILFVPACYSLVLGIMAIVTGAKLLGQAAYQEAPPTTIAIMQIINIISLDIVNLVLGILTLVFLKEPEVRAYYRG